MVPGHHPRFFSITLPFSWLKPCFSLSLSRYYCQEVAFSEFLPFQSLVIGSMKVNRSQRVMAGYSVLDYQYGAQCHGKSHEQGIVPHAQSENNVEIRTYCIEYLCLDNGLHIDSNSPILIFWSSFSPKNSFGLLPTMHAYNRSHFEPLFSQYLRQNFGFVSQSPAKSNP